MKRHGQLYPTLVSFSHLMKAYKKAAKGTRRNTENLQFFYFLEREMLQLKEELESLSYQPQAYRYFQISDPKERTISVASFRDRVVHHALVGGLEPIYEGCFIFHSYATRKEKGTHAAILQAQKYLRKNQWFFKTDIDKFFDSVDQEILMKIINRKIKDKRVLALTEKIIKNGGIEGRGLPIGNLTSQFFANVYLNPLDHFVKQGLKAKNYIRYMDDFVLFHQDKAKLKAFRREIEGFLEEELQLQLKPKATFINQASNGLTFLGKRIFRNTIRIARPNLKRLQRRMEKRRQEWMVGKIDEAAFLQSMNSHWANLSHFDTFQLRKRLLEKI